MEVYNGAGQGIDKGQAVVTTKRMKSIADRQKRIMICVWLLENIVRMHRIVSLQWETYMEAKLPE